MSWSKVLQGPEHDNTTI